MASGGEVLELAWVATCRVGFGGLIVREQARGHESSKEGVASELTVPGRQKYARMRGYANKFRTVPSESCRANRQSPGQQVRFWC